MSRKQVNDYAVFENVDGTVSINVYYQDGGTDAIEDLPRAEGKFIADLLQQESPISYDRMLKRITTSSFEPIGEDKDGNPKPLFSLENWLNNRSYIRNSINWEFANGVRNYSLWNDGQKEDLHEAYLKILHGQSTGMSATPSLVDSPKGEDEATTILSSNDAWNYFIAYVAQSLVIEADRRVPWSLLHQTDEDRGLLLDGRHFFRRRGDGTYEIDRNIHSGVTYGDPVRLFQFLSSNDLIGITHQETISKVIQWSKRLVRFSGENTANNVYDQWQYFGLPPIEHIISGTIRDSKPDEGIQHRTTGSKGTVGFFRVLLRTLNIPVKPLIVAESALPYFSSIRKYFSHGEDPYHEFIRTSTIIPNEELLIDQRTFDRWFLGPNAEDNVGRQTKELAILYLPNYLLHLHCDDLKNGRNHAESAVAKAFARYYTVSQLEGMNLWNRIESKVSSIGGCNHIP